MSASDMDDDFDISRDDKTAETNAPSTDLDSAAAVVLRVTAARVNNGDGKLSMGMPQRHYERIKKIGQGAYGCVFLVRDCVAEATAAAIATTVGDDDDDDQERLHLAGDDDDADAADAGDERRLVTTAPSSVSSAPTTLYVMKEVLFLSSAIQTTSGSGDDVGISGSGDGGGDTARSKALKEVRFLQRLTHPHIVGVHDYFISNQASQSADNQALCIVVSFRPYYVRRQNRDASTRRAVTFTRV
jgi:serine/threonine protein kinase